MSNLITINSNGQAVASSRDIAEHFDKQHKDVLESIKNLVAENSAAKSMFYETTYDNRGKQYPIGGMMMIETKKCSSCEWADRGAMLEPGKSRIYGTFGGAAGAI